MFYVVAKLLLSLERPVELLLLLLLAGAVMMRFERFRRRGIALVTWVAIVFLAIAILPLLGPAAQGLIARAPLPAALRLKLVTVVDQGLRGMRAFHDTRRLSSFLALTVLIWSLDAAGTIIGGAALGFRIPIAVAFLLLAALHALALLAAWRLPTRAGNADGR